MRFFSIFKNKTIDEPVVEEVADQPIEEPFTEPEIPVEEPQESEVVEPTVVPEPALLEVVLQEKLDDGSWLDTPSHHEGAQYRQVAFYDNGFVDINVSYEVENGAKT